MREFLLLLLILQIAVPGVRSQASLPGSIDQLIRESTDKKDKTTLTVGILLGDEKMIATYGNKLGESVELGYASQVFTTTLMASLAYDGKLVLTDRVDDAFSFEVRLPTYRNSICEGVNTNPQRDKMVMPPFPFCRPDPESVPACIAYCDLATHSSGLQDLKSSHQWDPFRERARGQPDEIFPEALFRSFERQKINVPPGTTVRYSSQAMTLLREAIAASQNDSYENLLERLVLEPLELRNTKVGGRSFAGASITTTLDDLLCFIDAQLSPPAAKWANIFEQTHQERLAVSAKHAPPNSSSAYGWWISPLAEDTGHQVNWVNGPVGERRIFLGFNKTEHTAVVLIASGPSRLNELAFDILRALSDLLPPANIVH